MNTRTKRKEASCHGTTDEIIAGSKRVILVGNPNVGKSVVFGNLTGNYVTVSNYPGTTVEVTRGNGRIEEKNIGIIDTPGMYSFLPITEEESVARAILLNEDSDAVIHVADAKSLERTLHLTLQLMETGLPLILNLNLMDEADRLGIKIDLEKLQSKLGIPVVATIATENKGMDNLRRAIINIPKKSDKIFRYDATIEPAITKITRLIRGNYRISNRALALLLLQDDPEINDLLEKEENKAAIDKIVEETKKFFSEPLNYLITIQRQKIINEIVKESTIAVRPERVGFRERLSRIMMSPITGLPFLLLVMYGLYEFVGVFGAQVAVDYLEKTIFGNYINPYVTKIVTMIIPWKILQDLFVNDYGIITLGVRYAIAIIMPIVATFFIAFSIIEDTGYLPRLAMLIDRVFKKIGLNGRAVIPVVLGFGCDTMATMVTRTLETRKEKVIATLLLALAIPCSAQLGVILVLLSGNIDMLWIFAGVMALVFMLVGFLASKIIPGESPLFYMEVPPLRWPKLSNVFTKTYTRVEWYFKEVLPLFILASVFIWIGKITKLFDLAVDLLSYPTSWIGLPKEAATAFLFGFFRRDFGAAGLYDLKNEGLLTGVPLLVSIVTIALFMPCIAQFSITIKERGWKMALGMAAFIFPFAFLVGFLVNLVLTTLGVTL
ncbi:MAG: ferrous iron transport protein B [FCB group bacterium]|nr:ferrous iron transport protein B [FCB group bacterium]